MQNDSTRVPLIIAAPGYRRGKSSDRPVGLIDIFPTLLELLDLPARADLEGRSLVPLLENPDRAWDRPIRTTFGPGNHSLRSTRWHYIRYGDGSEELYDHENDPHEWYNVAADPAHAGLLADLQARLPEKEARPIAGEPNSSGFDAWREAERLKPQAGAGSGDAR